MLTALERLSFRRKLTVLVAMSTTLALLLVGAAVVISDVLRSRQSVIEDLRTQGAITASAGLAALEFGDLEVALDALAPLEADADMIGAAYYDADGRLFQSIVFRDDVTDPFGPTAGDAGHRFEGSRATHVHPIEREGESLGSVVLVRDLSGVFMHVARQIGLLFAALAIALLLTLLLTRRLKRAVERPVADLADAARRVSRDRDYAVRVSKSGGEELGALTEAFNDMLTEIESRQAELLEHQDLLEQRVTERTRQLEERNAALIEAERRALEASHAKSEFLANMSHEIRSPMTAILGYAEMLQHEHGADEDLRAASIDTILRNGHHLLAIINDILDLSKLEAGRMDVELMPCSPAGIARDVVDLLRVRAEMSSLTLDLELDGEIPETIESDPTRLRQILVNLVGNAMKFTEEGSVRIVLGLEGSGANRLRIDVIDTGIGIDDAHLERLFHPFTQADASTTREYGGTGLGLTISQRCAELLGGTIEVTSEAGRGSCFSVRLPCGRLDDVAMLSELPPPGRRRRPAAQTRLDGVNVLVADDTPDNRRLVRWILETAGATVDEASTGRAALESARVTPYDVILMDMQMPELDGYEAAAALRSEGYDRTIVALTANAMRGDRERCLEAGMNDYVSKPVDTNHLLRVVARLCGRECDDLTTTPDEPSGDRIVDESRLLAQFEAAPELLVELIDMHLAEDDPLATLRAAHESGDLVAIERAAHTLKGSVANFRADATSDAALRVEKLAANGSADAIADAIRTLDDELEFARERLRGLRDRLAAR